MEGTTKELLKVLVKRSEELNTKVDKLAKEHFEMSLKFSSYINSQDKENIYFKSILEGNQKTNQKGLVERVNINESDIVDIKTDRKITAGKIGVAGLIFTAIGGVILKLLGVIKIIL